ncbi:MAG: hypothetical protein PVJ57_06925 [Phycisphaerae bacterium]
MTADQTDRAPLTPTAPSPEEQTFEAETAAAVQRLRTTLAELIAGVRGRVSKATDLQRALGVDMNVCCKMLRVISASGPLSASLHLPGIMALRMFLKAARKAGVREPAVEAAAQATDEFEELVNKHADDRTTFDSMVSALVDDEEAAQITFQHRRATFRGQRHLFGLDVQVHMKCLIVQPSEQDPRLLDLANVTGFVSLRRLRPTRAPIVLTPAYTMNDDGTLRNVQREPLIPTPDQTAGVALLRDFCSEPTLRLQTVPGAPGRVYGELAGVGVGKTAAVTCVEGHLNRAAVPRFREPGNEVGAHLAEMRIPCETLLLDLVIREDTCGPINPTARVSADHLAEVQPPGTFAPWQRIEPFAPVACLGRGPSVLYTPDYPRYPELGRYAFEQLGWDGDRFDVYRCRIEYPILPSTVALFFDLPAAPTESAD